MDECGRRPIPPCLRSFDHRLAYTDTHPDVAAALRNIHQPIQDLSTRCGLPMNPGMPGGMGSGPMMAPGGMGSGPMEPGDMGPGQ